MLLLVVGLADTQKKVTNSEKRQLLTLATGLRGSILRIVAGLSVMSGFASASACATINETYYVASNSAPNYYRVQIQGNAGWTKLKYSTGYYDREVIERLFGEFSIQKKYEDPNGMALEGFERLLDESKSVFIGNDPRRSVA